MMGRSKLRATTVNEMIGKIKEVLGDLLEEYKAFAADNGKDAGSNDVKVVQMTSHDSAKKNDFGPSHPRAALFKHINKKKKTVLSVNCGWEGRNKRALNDIGKAPGVKPNAQISRPVTRNFGAQLLAKPQAGVLVDIKKVIDACGKGNLGRFINHSCDPNCRT